MLCRCAVYAAAHVINTYAVNTHADHLHSCNVWSFCSDIKGCGSGCREAGGDLQDEALTVGPLGNCTLDGAFARGACMLAFADNPFNLTLSRDANWTSGFVLPKGGVATIDGAAKVAVAGVLAG